MDLYDSQSGDQVHDYNPGIAPNGLFWTVRVPNHALTFNHAARSARIVVEDLEVIDSFQIFGENEVPATVSFDITWTATGPPRHLAPGSDDPLDPTNLAGVFRDALAEGHFSGESITEPGGEPYSFEDAFATSAPLWAEMGYERNGVFLGHGHHGRAADAQEKEVLRFLGVAL